MMVNLSWGLCIWPVLITALCFLTPAKGNVTDKPNIVFVLADDYGYNDIGYHGSEIKTPALDELAASGVKLENYYVQPVCSPTRSQLMSGRYQIHTGLQHGNVGSNTAKALPADNPILAAKLKECGYSTHMVGKWHLGFYKQKYCPWKRGFDSFYGYLTGSENYYTHESGGALDLRYNEIPIRNESGHYSTHLFTEKAIDVIKAQGKSKPLFLYLAYQAVHGPMQVPEQYIKSYEHIKDRTRQIYAGMVSAMDEGVRNLTQALKDNGMWNNTVFIFSTDNGGDYHKGGNNYPLRGGKATHYEGGVRGVGFVAGPLVKSPGTINKEMIHVSDWYPSLVKLAGGKLNGTKPLDGYEMWDTISGAAPSKRLVLLHNIDCLTVRNGVRLYNDTFDNRQKAAIRVGDMKLITGLKSHHARNPLTTIDGHGDPTDNNLMLFNITADPYEQNDLSKSRPEIVRELLDHLHAFEKTAVPPIAPPKDPRSNPRRHGGVWGPWMD